MLIIDKGQTCFRDVRVLVVFVQTLQLQLGLIRVFIFKSKRTPLQKHQTAMYLRPRAFSQPGGANTFPGLKNIRILRPRALTSHFTSPLEDELSCPICFEIFTDPVVLKCSHSFCRLCLQQFWNKKATKKKCPVCRMKCSLTEPTVSLTLKNVCDAIAQEQKGQASATAGSYSANGTSKPEALCATHGEGLKLFCQYDEEVLCCVCQTSKKHQGHSVCPLEEAANDLKDEMRQIVIPLKKSLRHLYETKQEYDDITVHIKNQGQQTEKQVHEEFNELRQFLLREEAARIAVLAEEEETKKQRMKKKTDIVARDILTFSHAVIAIENEIANDDSLFLQNYKNVKMRAQIAFHEPEKVPNTLIDVAEHIASLKFRAWEKMQSLVEYIPVTLDPNTAYPCLSLSKSLTSVCNTGTMEGLPNNPERFDHFDFVLGSKGFTSGCHSWEVDVGQNNDWVIGVVKASVARKGKISGCPEGGFWTIALFDGKYTAMTSPHTPLDLKGHLERVRVKIDYDAGEVSFFDSVGVIPVYTFNDRFTEAMFPFFCPGANINGNNPGPLKICPVRVAVWNSASW
ncbi:tripartite motif-containing protein 35-like [Carassius auratus]|uniref:Tripartite motif-containing protein 35-like n=1 Tax=Carassius auratus TaxID=7957 RepID=A0A6P6KRB1_CARAU|nr:tripartite motif-containing protein 35-like [Carassius auratus]